MGLGTSSCATLGGIIQVLRLRSISVHLAPITSRPEPRQQRDFKGHGGNALSLAQGSEELRRLLVIKGSLPTTY